MNLPININGKELLGYLKDPWALSWVVSGLLTIFVPIITWNVQKGAYYDAYGYAVEAEDQERYYEEQQNDGDDNNNNNNNNNGNYYQIYKECSWINFACRKRQYMYATMDDNNEDGNNGQVLPNWYIFLGGGDNSEQMQRWKEDNTGERAEGQASTPGGLKFVYAWTIIMFLALWGYGAFALAKKRDVSTLVMLLGISASLGLMNAIMAAQGVISSDDGDMEDSYYGWYGQIGVLMAYTDFWIMLFSFGFLTAFKVRSYLNNKNEKQKQGEHDNDNEGDYDEFSDHGDKKDYSAAEKGAHQDYTAPVVEAEIS